VLAIAIPALVVAAGVLLFAAARRRDTGAATGMMSHETARRDRGPVSLDDAGAPVTGREEERAAVQARREESLPVKVEQAPVEWLPPDEEAVGVTRRQFFNRSIVGMFAFGLSGFGAASLAFLYTPSKGGFGSQIRVGALDDIKADIEAGDGFAYYPEGQMWITTYPSDALSKAEAVYTEPELAGMREGLIALWQKCPHLGCRVPQCLPSQWFECGCHGSQYNRVGEKKGGPAPRGMDRFAMTVDGGVLTVDTSRGGQILGPPIGTNTTGQEAEGPHCTGEGSH
ncbi:MAG: ubiquinol-cytochrome c reductase iron-sulfur subunit, partial [Acidimicrobiales bacterium]